MTNKQSLGPHLTLLTAAVALAGCSNWSYSPPLRGNPITDTWTVPQINNAAPASPTSFTEGLTKEYRDFAVELKTQKRDFADADYFARKGLKANQGVVVPPEDNANFLIPLEVPDLYRTELSTVRKRLVADLDNGGRDNKPLVAARAQERYDCWVERMEDAWWAEYHGKCYQDLMAALAELEGAPPQQPAQQQALPPQVREYRVYFEFDKFNLTADGRQIVSAAAADTKASQARIMLVGKADLAGGDAYNIKLSQHRADTVRAELVKDGIPADRIDERWVGFHEPPVPTAAGVREPRNRVVEITIK